MSRHSFNENTRGVSCFKSRAYLGNVKEYTLVGGGRPHGDVKDKKAIKGGPGGEAPGKKSWKGYFVAQICLKFVRTCVSAYMQLRPCM